MESRGLLNAAQRLPTIALRFGVSAAKMERALLDYTAIAREHSATPTLFVTGNLLERYPNAFQRIAERGAEFGVHGFVHTDYANLPLDRQKDDLAKTLSSFQQLGLSAAGFRGPYLRWNADSVAAARSLGLEYGSNRGVAWDVLDPVLNGHNGRRVEAYEKGLRLYSAVPSEKMLSLPAFTEGLIDLPASLPDDEAIVDRLRLQPWQREQVWRALVREVHTRGEMLVHTLHHERLYLCKAALRAMLEEARALSPRSWLASLRQAANWWRERSASPIDIEPAGEGRYRVTGGPQGATILARHVAIPKGNAWHEEWTVIDRGAAFGAASAPWIGLPRGAPQELVEFLRGEGFVVRPGPPDGAATYIDSWTSFRPEDGRRVLAELEAAATPLVRLWRWPHGARCAVCLTGDVDSMSLLDFFRRPLEV
jgi:hypothetical protein